jgi:hypothetical protein
MEPFNESETGFTPTALTLDAGGLQRHLSAKVQYNPYRTMVNDALYTFNQFMIGH